MNKKHLIGYAATGLVALGLGSASGSSGTAPSTATAPTVTVTAPSTTIDVPASPATVTVAAPTVTQTVQGPPKTVVAPPPAPAVAMPGDGTFQVGVDVQPGTYVSKAPDRNCYWARLTGGDGLDSIIDNGNSSGQVVVTIRKTDKFFESSGCSDWTKR